MEKNEISLMRISSKALCMLAFALALLFVMFPVSAGDFSSQQLIPLGKTTGIKLFSEGTMIVGFEEIAQGSASPAQKAGLECGDVILSVNGKEVESNGSLTSIMSELEDGRAEVVYERSGEQKSCTVSAVYDKERERWMMGAWVRDSMAGIGTITYVELQKAASMLVLDVHLEGEVTVPCDRCLADLVLPVDYDGRLTVKFSDEITDYDGDLMWINPADGELNLAQYLYESIVLSLPYRRIHGEDADGNPLCDARMLERFRIVSEAEFDAIEAESRTLARAEGNEQLQQLKARLEAEEDNQQRNE